MKRLKKGFTLAEVLITLGIIGVVAAIVMPSVMTNYTYKTVGVKLSKFASQLEGSSRAFVVQNDSFSADDENLINNFLEESFLIVNRGDLMSDENDTFDGITDNVAREDNNAFTEGGDNRIINLKDGTSVIITTEDSYEHGNDDLINTTQVGDVAFRVSFSPNVTGLPNRIFRSFDYVVTELGYVYRDQEDECLDAIINANYNTNARFFDNNPACTVEETGGGEGTGN